MLTLILAILEEGRRAFKISAGKPTRKGLEGMLRCRWEDNIKRDLKK